MAAAHDGQILTIVYHGGSQPGTIRDIAPVSVSDGRVRALCLASDQVKTFLLEKIDILGEGANIDAAKWDPAKELVRKYRSLSNVAETENDFFSRLGWHIELSNDCISLHRRFKSGKPLKTSDVSIRYEEFTFDSVVDEFGEFHEINKRKRLRPWTVCGKSKHTTSYKSLDDATARMIEWAEYLKPKTK